MNQLQEEFYQVMTKLRGSRSRAASTQVPKEDARVTEIVNGLLVSKPNQKEPEIIDLQEYARSGKVAASVQDIDKVQAIAYFVTSNGLY